ncbi:MAG: PHP domain-containing protein [Clostridiales bacterium]|nr:PHP domain-containing protein [Clostridiales bacterium]
MYFIRPEDCQLKANLHSHSVLSDGKLTPEELVSAYKEREYSVLAITDHEAPYDHSVLSTSDFLLITGYEVYIRNSPTCAFDVFKPEIHLNLLAREPHNTTFIGYDPNYCKYMPHDVARTRKMGEVPGSRSYTKEYIQRFINIARENGYLISYNHPCWSMENPGDILEYEGFFSLEVFNTGSMMINGYENNMALYDQLLRRGRRIFCHGADDNHNKKPFDDLLCDSFGAWTMILADKPDYDVVITALEQGRFYASTGVRINAFETEGKHVHMEFSPAQRVIMHISPKRSVNVYQPDGKAFTSCDMEIPDEAPYVYFSVIASDGSRAEMRAFTRKELGI